MSLPEVLERMRSDPELGPNFTTWCHLPPTPPTLAPFPEALDRRLVEVLARRGIDRLYSHQGQAVEAVLAGQNVAVVTPTASGKTLCYNLPVLHTLLGDGEARALYLFPTKALAQDQMEGSCTASSPPWAWTSGPSPTTATLPRTPAAP